MATFLATDDFLLVSMVLAAVLALTLYLPLMAGQLSVASPGFYALGGYIAAILSTKVFHPGPGLYPLRLVLIEMAAAAVVSGILGVVVGLPALRLRGIFLALATIAFVQVLGVVALNLEITGRRHRDLRHSAAVLEPALLHVARHPTAPASMLFVARLERSRTGRALVALREDRAGGRRDGRGPDVLQGPRVHHERGPGRHGRRHQRALHQYVELAPGELSTPA